MNNINSVENTRAVVTDTNVTKDGQRKEAAKPEALSGKDLPSSESTAAPQQVTKPVESAVERTARVEQAVDDLNDYAQSLQRDLRFSMDEDLGRAVVSVVDHNTQEVIRQIPNETALHLARNLKGKQEQQMLRELEQQNLQVSGNGADSSLGLINTRV